jgi:iron-sulfur cluster insertion protein
MLNVTEKAVDQLRDYLDEENKYLRIFVEGGGCSGFQYGFDIEEKMQEDDFEISLNKFSILIDSISMQYLQGATLDFTDDLMGTAFVIKNPNAQSTCGCGSSFSA